MRVDVLLQSFQVEGLKKMRYLSMLWCVSRIVLGVPSFRSTTSCRMNDSNLHRVSLLFGALYVPMLLSKKIMLGPAVCRGRVVGMAVAIRLCHGRVEVKHN